MSVIILPLTVSASAQKCKKQRIAFPKGSNMLTLQGRTNKCNDFLLLVRKDRRLKVKLTSTKGNAYFYMNQADAEEEGAHGYCEECQELDQYFDYTQDWRFLIDHGSFNGKPEGVTNYKITFSYTTPRTINGGMLNRRAKFLPPPVIPPTVSKAESKGEVKVEVVVEEDGTIERAEAVSGLEFLKLCSEAAARAAKFKPTIIKGKRVRVAGFIIYNFK